MKSSQNMEAFTAGLARAFPNARTQGEARLHVAREKKLLEEGQQQLSFL